MLWAMKFYVIVNINEADRWVFICKIYNSLVPSYFCLHTLIAVQQKCEGVFGRGRGEGVCWKLNLGMRIECGHEDWAAIWSAFAYQQLLNMWLQVLTYISHTSQMPKEKCLLRLKNSLRFNPTIRIRGTCTLTLSLSFPSNTIVMSEGGILTSNSPCLCILSQLPVWVYLLYTQLAVWIYLLHT